MKKFRVKLIDIDVAYYETEAQDFTDAIEIANSVRDCLHFETEGQEYKVVQID